MSAAVGRVAVHGVDRGLQLVRARAVAAQAGPDQVLALGDHGAVPPAPVLVAEQDQGAVGARCGPGARASVSSSRASRPSTSGSSGISSASSRARRIASAHSSERTRSSPGRGRVPLVEDQVDDREHERQPVGQLRIAGHPVGNPGGADLPLGPDQALGDRGLGHEERARDLGRLQPGDQPQGQGDLRLGGQRRVTAGEDQPQAVILHRSHLLRRLGAGAASGPPRPRGRTGSTPGAAGPGPCCGPW